MNHFVKQVAITVCLSLFLTSTVCAKTFKAVMVTDVAGLGDKSFNDAAWKGMQKAKKELGVEVACLQSYEQADYILNLNLAAQDADVVIAMGFLLADAVQKISKIHPDKHFIFIDGIINSPNVASFDYKSEEGAYLAGIIAAATSEKGIVGIVEGMEIPPVKAFEAGFRAGVKTANKVFEKNVQVRVAVTGSFNDPSKGKSLSKSLVSQGADIVFQLAGNTGLGVFETVKESPAGIYAIGSDLNQDSIVPGRVLTSVMKKTEVAAFNAIKDAKNGKFKAGSHYLGLAIGAIDITDLAYSKKSISPKTLELVKQARQDIVAGKLKVPNSMDALKSF